MEKPPVDYCADVATEVWVRCWSQASSKDLRRLVLVCRYFRDICQPILFEHQQFEAPSSGSIHRNIWTWVVYKLHLSGVRIRKMAGSPHVSSVRSWHFGGSFSFPALIDSHPSIVNIGLPPESPFPTPEDIILDAPMREALATLPRLQTLELISCDVHSPSGPVLQIQDLTWGRLSYYHPHDEDPTGRFNLVSHETLKSLSLNGDNHTRALLSALSDDSKIAPNLLTISIHLSDSLLPVFLALLPGCSTLKRLEISHSSLSAHPQGRLATTAMPRLEAYKGPRILAAFFISDRPVSILELIGASGFTDEHKAVATEIINDLTNVALSSTGVRILSTIAPTEGARKIIKCIARQWPDLQQLSLALKEPPRPPRPLPADLAPDDDSDGGGDFHGDEEDSDDPSVDERTVDLSDVQSLAARSDDESFLIVDNDSDDEGESESEPIPIPEILAPGYLYTTGGLVSAPVDLPSARPVYEPKTFIEFMDCICANIVTFPPSLETLSFEKLWPTRRDSKPLTLGDYHRVVLALDRRLPSLRMVDFGHRQIWRRHRSTWTQMSSGTKIASLVIRQD
ncbi:hypothetical protein C8R43DRAFT_1244580 [Mycena crocata]|nr:hypothetical protein C8R43DRAFT_1244580 [Mycena crocata]